MTDKPTFWNERVGRVDPIREGQPLRWIFGPCKADPNPNQKWCNDCYGVVVEEGAQRRCRACKASEPITDPARQDVVDELVHVTGKAVREWRRHNLDHISCSECESGYPTFEQIAAKAVEEWLTDRVVR